jgi:hypothetical protein
LVDARHRISKDPISFQFRNELRMRNQRLVPAFRYDSQIREILQQLFILGDRENDRCPFAVFASKKGLARTHNLSFNSKLK